MSTKSNMFVGYQFISIDIVFFSSLVLELQLRTSLTTFSVLNEIDLIQFNHLELGEGIKLVFSILWLLIFLSCLLCKWWIHLSKSYLLLVIFKIWLLRTVEYLMKLVFLTNKVISYCMSLWTLTSMLLYQIPLSPTFKTMTTVPNQKSL